MHDLKMLTSKVDNNIKLMISRYDELSKKIIRLTNEMDSIYYSITNKNQLLRLSSIKNVIHELITEYKNNINSEILSIKKSIDLIKGQQNNHDFQKGVCYSIFLNKMTEIEEKISLLSRR